METGEVQYTEARLIETLLQACTGGGEVPIGIEVPVREEPRVVDPTAIRTLLTPGGNPGGDSGGLAVGSCGV